MPRRANKEGSVYFRKSDKKWVASVTLENGKRKVVYASTQQEAIKKRNALIREQEQGKIVTKPGQTVAQYLEYWLDVYKQSIRPRSYERYKQIVRLHVVPVIGKMRLDT